MEKAKKPKRMSEGKQVRVKDVPRTTIDIIQAAKAHRKLETRRVTGLPTGKEYLEKLAKEMEEDARASALEERGESGSPSPVKASPGSSTSDVIKDLDLPKTTGLSAARMVVRQYVERQLTKRDTDFTPCEHTAEEWCNCPNRFTGFCSTFVDKSQPPYTIWHAGTDYVDIACDPDNVFPDGTAPVEVFNLTGEKGFCVQICNFGARVVSVLMPDNDGLVEEVMPSLANALLAQENADLYINGLLGRIAARVPNGLIRGPGFNLSLDLNEEKKNHINGGGETGFDRLPWQAAVAGDELVFTLQLPDTLGGYPGDALLTARYSVRPPNTLRFRLTGSCTKPCPFMPAMRLPLNLAGHGAGKLGMMEHTLTINASRFYVTDKKEFAPIGRTKHVANSIYDFRIPRKMSTMHPLAPWPGYRAYLRLEGAAGAGQAAPGATSPGRSRAGSARLRGPRGRSRATRGVALSPQRQTRPGDEDDGDDDEDAELPLAAKLYHAPSRRAVEIRTNQPVLYLETVRETLPVDPEDLAEHIRRQRELEKALAVQAVDAMLQAVQKGTVEEDSEEEEGENDEEEAEISPKKESGSAQPPKKKAKVMIAGGDDDDKEEDPPKKKAKVMTFAPGAGDDDDDEDDHEKKLEFSDVLTEHILEDQPLVVGRGGFLYCRCGAITLQPQREPLVRRKVRPGATLPPPADGTKIALPPGRRLLYAASWRFYVTPRQRLHKRRPRDVQYAAEGERLDDARARFDVCDLDSPSPPLSPARASPAAAAGSGTSLAQADLQADRCSIESIYKGKGRFDRKFLGPPTARVPSPVPQARHIVPDIVNYLIHMAVDSCNLDDIMENILDALLGTLQGPERDSGVTGILSDLVQGVFLSDGSESEPRRSQRRSSSRQGATMLAATESVLAQLPEDERLNVVDKMAHLPELPEDQRKSALQALSDAMRDTIKKRVSIIKKMSDKLRKSFRDSMMRRSMNDSLHSSLRMRDPTGRSTLHPFYQRKSDATALKSSLFQSLAGSGGYPDMLYYGGK